MSQPSSLSNFEWINTVTGHVWDCQPELKPYTIHDSPLKVQMAIVWVESLQDYMWYVSPWDDGDFETQTIADGITKTLAEAQEAAEKAYTEYRIINPIPEHQKQGEDWPLKQITRLVSYARNKEVKDYQGNISQDILDLVHGFWKAKGENAFVVGAPHTNTADCPSYYDGCNCTIEALNSFIEDRQKVIKDFDTWFDEIEGFGLRSERFFADLAEPSMVKRCNNARQWLWIAFKLGRETKQ